MVSVLLATSKDIQGKKRQQSPALLIHFRSSGIISFYNVIFPPLPCGMPLTFIPSLIECVRVPAVPTITAKVNLDISHLIREKSGDDSCWREEPFKVLLTVVKSPIVWLKCPHFLP